MIQRAEQLQSQLPDLLAQLQRLGQPDEGRGLNPEAVLSSLQAFLLPKGVAGSFHLFRGGFRTLFDIDSGGKLTADQQLILQWVEGGYSPTWVAPDSPEQQQHPLFRKKRSIVLSMLRRSVPWGNTLEPLLNGSRPHRLRMPNMRSAEGPERLEFVREALAGELQTEAMKDWHWDEGPPEVVSPLGVAPKGESSLRLVKAFNYSNQFDSYRPVRYENLQQFMQLLRPGMYLYKSDQSAAYHQLPLHPDCWKYLAVQFEGRLMCCTCLAFGMASACWAYTLVMRTVYSAVRRYGEIMTFLIDDRGGAAFSKEAALFRSTLVARIQTCLGIVFSQPKCVFEPCSRLELLGLELDTSGPPCMAYVPDRRLSKFERSADAVLQRGSATAREEAQLSGQLTSMAMALPSYCKVYFRSLHPVIEESRRWDTEVGLASSLQEELLWLRQNLRHINGAPFGVPPQPVLLELAVDTSQYMHAAVVRLTAEGQPVGTMQIPFPDQLLEQLGRSSSTLREMLGYEYCFQLAPQHWQLRGGRVVILGDSQSGFANMQRCRAGDAEMFGVVRRVTLLAANQQVQITWEHRPRTDPKLWEADSLTREEDASDFRLTSKPFQQICRHPLPPLLAAAMGRCTWGQPTLDPLADTASAKAPVFYSKHLCPGSAGMDGYAQPWPQLTAKGQRQLTFVFPGPVSDPAVAISKIREEMCDSILVVPTYGTGPWVGALHTLPIRDRLQLGYRAGMYQAGPRVPKDMQQPTRPLTAYFISYVPLS